MKFNSGCIATIVTAIEKANLVLGDSKKIDNNKRMAI